MNERQSREFRESRVAKAHYYVVFTHLVVIKLNIFPQFHIGKLKFRTFPIISVVLCAFFHIAQNKMDYFDEPQQRKRCYQNLNRI